jgi:hypothetical protein
LFHPGDEAEKKSPWQPDIRVDAGSDGY